MIKKIQISHNLLQVQVSTSMAAYFKLLEGIACKYCRTLHYTFVLCPYTSPTSFQAFFFFSLSSLLHLLDTSLQVTHPQFYGLRFCFFCFRFQICLRRTQEWQAQSPLLALRKSIKCGTCTSSGQRRNFFCPAHLLRDCAQTSITQWRAVQNSSSCSGHNQETLRGAVQQNSEDRSILQAG